MKLEQRLQGLWPLVDPLPRVALRRQSFGHGLDRQLVRVQRVDRVPGQRRGYLAAGASTHRPRAEDGLVRRVLVVVDEDATAPLFLPPRRGDQLGTAPLELARGCDRGCPYLVGVPARLEPDVDMKATIPRRLRITGNPEPVEQAPELTRRSPHLLELDARLWVEIESQLVGHIGTVMNVGP